MKGIFIAFKLSQYNLSLSVWIYLLGFHNLLSPIEIKNLEVITNKRCQKRYNKNVEFNSKIHTSITCNSIRLIDFSNSNKDGYSFA